MYVDTADTECMFAGFATAYSAHMLENLIPPIPPISRRNFQTSVLLEGIFYFLFGLAMRDELRCTIDLFGFYLVIFYPVFYPDVSLTRPLSRFSLLSQLARPSPCFLFITRCYEPELIVVW